MTRAARSAEAIPVLSICPALLERTRTGFFFAIEGQSVGADVVTPEPMFEPILQRLRLFAKPQRKCCISKIGGHARRGNFRRVNVPSVLRQEPVGPAPSYRRY